MNLLDPCAARVLYALSEAKREGKVLDRDDLTEMCRHYLRIYQRATRFWLRQSLSRM
jgi:hypothetical protein